jgi:hypothetical protein
MDDNHGHQEIMSDAERVAKLQEFKDFVHITIDAMGVPTHPNGEHSKEGCRIGDRLEILATAVELLEEFGALNEPYGQSLLNRFQEWQRSMGKMVR